MKTFKATGAELERLAAAARLLRQANEAVGKANKEVEAAKAELTRWLKEERDCEVESLAIGDIVQIEGVVLLEVGKMNKFDEKGFLLAEPGLHASWKKDTPVRRFKVLVPA